MFPVAGDDAQCDNDKIHKEPKHGKQYKYQLQENVHWAWQSQIAQKLKQKLIKNFKPS